MFVGLGDGERFTIAISPESLAAIRAPHPPAVPAALKASALHAGQSMWLSPAARAEQARLRAQPESVTAGFTASLGNVPPWMWLGGAAAAAVWWFAARD